MDEAHRRMATDAVLLRDLPGGRALLDWFGRPWTFHDAGLRSLSLLRPNDWSSCWTPFALLRKWTPQAF